MKKTIQIKCKGADLLPYDSLMQFQGDLKTLSKKNLEKLKTSIIKSGFRFPFYIWVNNEQNKIINGHQRDRVLKSLKEDGWEIPLLPVVYIYADNEKEAKEAILENSSQYGEWNKLELETWLDGIDDEIRDTLRFVEKEILTVEVDDPNKEWDGMPEYENKDEMGVRQLIVHFKEEKDVVDFVNLIKQKITSKTKYIWYPEQPFESFKELGYKNES